MSYLFDIFFVLILILLFFQVKYKKKILPIYIIVLLFLTYTVLYLIKHEFI
jgi:hypothetical protein